jgi:hypothetical protein
MSNVIRTGFLAILMAAPLSFAPSLAAATLVSVDSTAISGTGDLSILISNVSDLYAFQFDLSFDASLVQLLNISEGGFLPSAGTTMFVPGTIDNTTGSATGTADTLVGMIPGASGSGVLASFTFQRIAPGTSPISLSNVVLLDSNLNEIPFTIQNGSITMVPEPRQFLAGFLVLIGWAFFTRARRRSFRA